MIRVVVSGNERQVKEGTTAAEVLKGRKALAARVDGRLVDLVTVLSPDSEVEPVGFDSEAGRDIYWHSASHLMAQAVKQLFPDAKVAIGPAITDGFYYDFEVRTPFTDEDLRAIEKRMRQLSKKQLKIAHKWLPRDEAIKLFKDRGEDYKLEIIDGIPEDSISVYEQEDFVDLCRGPHVPNTGRIKSFKLLSVAGAYWHGDEHNQMLSRIYGIAFPDADQLKRHLDNLEEAKRRDHRKLGTELDLYSFHEEAGPGLMFWHPKGATVRRMIQQYWEAEHIAAGYQLVVSPHIARSALWRTSGHYDHFRENMFTIPMGEEEEYVLKPMNCPGHMLIYKSRVHSYRELPLRMGEWGVVYRNERSGTLHGAMRVRGITQDDAHIFCTERQIEAEVQGVVELTLRMLRTFGFERFSVDLSVRDPGKPDKYLGTDEQWSVAEKALVAVLERLELPYKRAEGEAVFYGPKIDIKLLDALGREWQCPTCQFDFNLGDRFKLYYVGEDGHHHSVYLVHRTVLGGIERFMGILVEHYGGNFPTWLAPVQARVMAVTDSQNEYAGEVYELFRRGNVRVEMDSRNDKIGYKISEAERLKIPYMVIVGGREAENRTASLRRHGEGDLGVFPLGQALKRIQEEAAVPVPR